jgi:hypothetical protein
MRLQSLFLAASLGLGLAPQAHANALENIAGAGPPEERSAVIETLETYLRVTDFKDQKAIAKAFHPTAVLSSVSDSGELRAMTQDEWWERISRIPDATPRRESRIRLIEVVNVAAVARIDIRDSRGQQSTDLFTLQKTKDGWKIVNKVLSEPL